MSAGIHELWSAADEDASVRLVRGVADEDLVGALLAVEGASAATRAEVGLQVAVLAERVRALSDTLGPHAALARAIASEAGIIGATSDYHRPDHSYLSRVLARRRGLPILVSALWRAVGRAADIEVDGVGLPGHFVVRVAGELADPFAGGALLDDAGVAAIVERFAGGRPFDPAWLLPVSIGAWVERVLRNLVNSFSQAGDRPRLYRTSRLLALVAPTDAGALLRVAELTEEFGAYELAARLYQELALAFEHGREAQVAAIRAVELTSRTRVLN